MLCGLCQGFDVRSLLCQATASVPKQDPPINWNYPEVLGFYKHRAGLSALKQSAENGCDLCMLFWDTCTHVAGKEQVAQVLQGKNAAVEQDIYIGTDAWNPQTHNLPNVVITQNHSYPDSDPACADLKVLGLFEVYAERGKNHLAACRQARPDSQLMTHRQCSAGEGSGLRPECVSGSVFR